MAKVAPKPRPVAVRVGDANEQAVRIASLGPPVGSPEVGSVWLDRATGHKVRVVSLTVFEAGLEWVVSFSPIPAKPHIVLTVSLPGWVRRGEWADGTGVRFVQPSADGKGGR